MLVDSLQNTAAVPAVSRQLASPCLCAVSSSLMRAHAAPAPRLPRPRPACLGLANVVSDEVEQQVVGDLEPLEDPYGLVLVVLTLSI